MWKTRTENLTTMLRQVRPLWMRVTATVAAGIALAGCATTMPVNKPCGVITDSLGDVQAATPEGNRRIDAHFERGVRAGCWERSSAKSIS